MNQAAIGSYIAKKRREKNLTQEQLAETLGVSNKTISKWANGKCMPGLQHHRAALQRAFRYTFRTDGRRGCGGGQRSCL